MRRALLAPALLAAIAAPAAAENERALSLEANYATFDAPGVAMMNMPAPTLTPDFGFALGGVYEQMLGSDVGLRGEVILDLFRGGNTSMQSATSYAALADVGFTFRFDVLKYVPYACAGVGGVLATGGPIADKSDFVVVLGGGLDILSSRERSWGIEGRLASFAGDITLVTFGIRGTVRWGYF
ncbi:MAG TPA: hypothetical protein VGM39_17550 [Kofleriaceae bacterium]|jgi:opacity protein-like surface antigen